MVTYGANELIPSSEFAKKFGSYLSQIKDGSAEKLAILKNNKVEAVLISKDEYEAMKEALVINRSKQDKYFIEPKVLQRTVRTSQAIEGYAQASDEVKAKTKELKERYGIKVSV